MNTTPNFLNKNMWLNPANKAEQIQSGAYSTWNILANGGLAGWPVLRFEISYNQNYTNSPAIVDYLGYKIINKLFLRFKNKGMMEHEGHIIRMQDILHLCKDKKDIRALLIGGNLSIAECRQNMLKNIRYHCQLDWLFFDSDLHNWLPMKNWNDLLEVVVYWKDLSKVCTTIDGLPIAFQNGAVP